MRLTKRAPDAERRVLIDVLPRGAVRISMFVGGHCYALAWPSLPHESDRRHLREIARWAATEGLPFTWADAAAMSAEVGKWLVLLRRVEEREEASR